MGNGKGHIKALLLIATTVNLHRDKFAGALAVTHQSLGQRHAGLLQSIAQRSVEWLVGRLQQGIAGRTGGHQHAGIIGGSVAVYRDPVKRHIHGICQQGLQQCRAYRHIRGQIGQHGGHVGPQHAGALGNTGEHMAAPVAAETH